jgi:hypothetical protein
MHCIKNIVNVFIGNNRSEVYDIEKLKIKLAKTHSVIITLATGGTLAGEASRDERGRPARNRAPLVPAQHRGQGAVLRNLLSHSGQ